MVYAVYRGNIKTAQRLIMMIKHRFWILNY